MNPFRYRGYYYDIETGFYYLNSRFYDSEVGKFINADTTDILSDSANLYDKNLYAYCDNNPIIRKDASGECWLTGATVIVGAVINVATTYLAAVITGQKYTLLDGVVAAGAGAINAVKIYGPLLNGLLTGTYALVMAYRNGASISEALLVGSIAGICSGASISNLAGLTGDWKILAINAASDLVFGTGANSISAATYKSVTSKKSRINNKEKGNSTVTKVHSPRTEHNTKYILPKGYSDKKLLGNPYERFLR